MFGFLDMIGNYEDRKVDNYQGDNNLEIDTCSVTDGEHDYETAVAHPEYNHGKWVIVEAYDTKDEAQAGHNKWVKKMTGKKLPAKLTDCTNDAISKLCDKLDFLRQAANG